MDKYDQILSSLFTRFPSVQKCGFGDNAYKPGLEHMLEFDRRLGTPSAGFRSVHVAGTNGKGSVSSMLASSLAASGLRVGLYTSPHLVDFRERMRIVEDDKVTLIPRDDVMAFIDRWSADFDALDLSFFEITTGMAFDWFAREQVDIAVIEVGLGGRLDSTNIIEPELSVVTSIGLDHCAQLGSTRALIAGEKAGIFKPGAPAVVGCRDDETAEVFEGRARQVHCPLFFADEYAGECGFELPDAAGMDLKGEYQQMNLATVFTALDILGFEPETDAICHTAARTAFRGRWEQVSASPLTICDIGHNPPALALNFAQLRRMMDSGTYDKLIMVYGVMADKALDDIIPLMPADAEYVFTTPPTPRAMPAEEILSRFSAATGKDPRTLHSTSSVAEALALLSALSSGKSLIYIGGSAFVVAEALKLLDASH